MIFKSEKIKINTVPEVNQALIEYCAPVLLGRKPAALFTLPSMKCFVCLEKSIKNLLSVKIMKQYQSSVLVMVYDKSLMELSLLTNSEVSNALLMLGYNKYFSVEEYLSSLKLRFQNSADFPHEIGLFLGYPPEDVFGFIENKGQKHKYCGIWKVYGDEEYSKRCFEEYKYCRRCMKEHLLKGGAVEDFAGAYGFNVTKMKNNETGGSFYE